MPTQIYQRPLMEQGDWSNTPIRIVGLLSDYELGVAYEGRLQIVNSVGPHHVKQIGGDQLPEGSSIIVDEDTQEIVVAWPPVFAIPGSTNEYLCPIENYNFEGEGGWSFGMGWRITNENPIQGVKSGGYLNQKGEAVLSHNSRFKAVEGKTITASCSVRQGGSSSGNAGASVMLEWRDDQDNLLGRSEGNRIMSGKSNRVSTSTVRAVPPPNTRTVNIAANGIRKRQNRLVWVDNFKWDLTYTEVIEPINPDESYYLELMVRDSTGREAFWNGTINFASHYLTSRLFPIEAPFDVAEASANIVGFIHKNSYISLPDTYERVQQSAVISSFVHKGQPTVRMDEDVRQTASISAFVHKGTPTIQAVESVAQSAVMAGFAHKLQPATYPIESATASAQITGFTHAI